WARATPDAPVIVFGRGAAQRTWSYAEIEAWSRRIASRLIDCGVAPGDRCALGLPNSPELFAALFGIARAGAIATPLNPRATSDAARYVFGHAEVSGAIVGAAHAADAASLAPRVIGPADAMLREAADEPSTDDALPRVDPDSGALLVYT